MEREFQLLEYLGKRNFRWELLLFLAFTQTHLGCSSDDFGDKIKKAPSQITIDNTGSIQDIKSKMKEFNKRFETLNQTLGQQTTSIKLNNLPTKWEGIGKLNLAQTQLEEFKLFDSIPRAEEQSLNCQAARPASPLNGTLTSTAGEIIEWIEKLDTPQPAYHSKMAQIEIRKGEDLQPFSLAQRKSTDTQTRSSLVEAATNGDLIQIAHSSYELDQKSGKAFLARTFIMIDLFENIFELHIHHASQENAGEFSQPKTKEAVIHATWKILPEEKAEQILSHSVSEIDRDCISNGPDCRKTSGKSTSVSGRLNPGLIEVKFQDISQKESAEFGLIYESQKDGGFQCKIDYANGFNNL